MPCAVILTALQVEYLAVRTHLSNLREEIHPQGTIYERGQFVIDGRQWDVGIAEIGAGNVGAATEAERAIAFFNPELLFFVGIAGGIRDVAIGDVVVATKVFGYEAGKVGDNQFLTRPTLGQSAYALLQRSKVEARKQDWLQRLSNMPEFPPRIFVNPIAAGEKVIASRKTDVFEFLRSSYNDAVAVEMEGFGFLSSAFAYPSIKAIVIRGISDLIAGKNDASFAEAQGDEQFRQELASRHASAFAFEILAKFNANSENELSSEEEEGVEESKAEDCEDDEECPYQGLNHFTGETAKFFFGHENQIHEIVEKIEQGNFVPVIGASGSGKSSIVHAGVVPQLKGMGWTPIFSSTELRSEPLSDILVVLKTIFKTLNKTNRAIKKIDSIVKDYDQDISPLLEQISSSDKKILLVVDQFEEFFTLCSAKKCRDRFIEILAKLAGSSANVSVLTAMRADFFQDCLEYPFLADLIESSGILISPIQGESIKSAIIEPAKLKGYSFADGLLKLIMTEIGEEQNFLPLLQFALTELWNKRDKRAKTLTTDSYEAIGGIFGALNSYAEELYDDLSDTEQDYVKRICLKLIRTGPETRDTRQRRLKRSLLTISASDDKNQEDIQGILNDLMDARLLSTSGEKGEWIDLAHEALMSKWNRFEQWRHEDRGLRRIIERIEDAYRDWEHSKQDNYLVMGGLLEEVKNNWSDLQPYLDTATRKFCEKSIELESSSFNKQLVPQINSEMLALADLARARLLMNDPGDPYADALADLYSERLGQKNDVGSESFSKGGVVCEVCPEDLFVGTPKLRAKDRVWSATLFAKVGILNLRWGQVFVNTSTGRSELLLDSRPSAWTEQDVVTDGQKISKLSLKGDSFTRFALDKMTESYSNFYGGEKQVANYGGWLKDFNRKYFQTEFAQYRELHPDASDDEVAQYAIRKTSFGRNRLKLGIDQFTILMRDGMEIIPVEGLGPRNVPVKILVLKASKSDS